MLALASLAYILLAVMAHNAVHGTVVDHAVLAWMVDHRHSWLTTVAVAITNVGSPVVMGTLAVLCSTLLWWRLHSPVPGLVVVATLAGAAGISTLTKTVVGARRPAHAVQLILEVDPAFPSGHVTGTLTLLGMIAVIVGRHRRPAVRSVLAWAVVTVTAAVALTRLYLGVHWLTDISGGLVLGSAAVTLGSATLGTVAGSSSRTGGHRAESPLGEATRVA
ncbi:phosphatase PAP2 family protein [Mycolicibacterium obuense]|uniref:PAP2 superfamily protein n=1 Tax=Mycolicibacterium obuense TaxID=1807 RepID=A0A0J6VYN4_9MYCO|nr:phosphatase PAP2 family protein [Mycolicibacterium obuense]KMO76185.1 PAP2 superfamily protein [Mycolicibacterium obuense]